MSIDIEFIQKEFHRKREALNKSIQIGMSLMGKEVPKEALPATAVLSDVISLNCNFPTVFWTRRRGV